MTIYRTYESDGGAWDEMVNDGKNVTRDKKTGKVIKAMKPESNNFVYFSKMMRERPRQSYS